MIILARSREHLAELGHTLDWRLVGPVSDNKPGDPGWQATLDGEVIARGGALGILAAEPAATLEKRAIDVRPWCASSVP